MNDETGRHRRQIETLLAYPGVGPLVAPAIARNLGVSEAVVEPILRALVHDGRVIEANGCYTAAGGH